MESNEHKQPVIDIDYIDKLLSTYSPKTEESVPPAEAPVEVAPAAEAPVPPAEAPVSEEAVSEKKTGKQPLLILAVIALLGVGFLLGWLVKPVSKDSEEPTKSTSPAGTTDAPLAEPGIAVDYASMSTQQLISIAVRIDGLSRYGRFTSSSILTFLTADIYEAMRQENPVLIELETRPDAAQQLQLFALASSSLDTAQAAIALLGYFVNILGFEIELFQSTPDCEWVCHSDTYATVYEYTEAPTVYPANIESEFYSGPAAVFSFDEQDFLLHGQQGSTEGNSPNFWFRVEVSDPAILDANPDPTPELTKNTDGAWVTVQKYGENEGWFVYGYAPPPAEVIFSLLVSDEALPVSIPLSVAPLPETELYTPELAQLLTDSAYAYHILNITQHNADRDMAAYPLLAELLSRDDGISCLLSIAQETRFSVFSWGNPFGNVMELLALPCIQEQMTNAQQQAVALLLEQGYFYAACTSDSNMDFLIYVSLTPGAQELWQRNWTLEAEFSGNGGTLDVRESGAQLTGWVISGKAADETPILLRLKQGSITLELQEISLPLMSLDEPT